MLTKIKVYEYDCMLYSENLQKKHPPPPKCFNQGVRAQPSGPGSAFGLCPNFNT